MVESEYLFQSDRDRLGEITGAQVFRNKGEALRVVSNTCVHSRDVLARSHLSAFHRIRGCAFLRNFEIRADSCPVSLPSPILPNDRRV